MSNVTALRRDALSQSPTLASWQNWPGARKLEEDHPKDTVYVGHDRIPQYPGGTTCANLGEPEPYFPIDWVLGLLVFVAFLLYVVWPLYKSVYGDDDLFQTNHEAYRAKMEAAGKGKDEVLEE
ncbi:hypothetical protein N0V86_007217 [Didymella sp. IMI 355093]|nr:hypothetical protein N0V86_007217 [Didymella sp. IMI 355093]